MSSGFSFFVFCRMPSGFSFFVFCRMPSGFYLFPLHIVLCPRVPRAGCDRFCPALSCVRHLRWRVSFAFTSGGAPKYAYFGLNWPISQKNPQKFASIFRSIGTHACSLSEQAVFFFLVISAGYYPAFTSSLSPDVVIRLFSVHFSRILARASYTITRLYVRPLV